MKYKYIKHNNSVWVVTLQNGKRWYIPTYTASTEVKLKQVLKGALREYKKTGLSRYVYPFP